MKRGWFIIYFLIAAFLPYLFGVEKNKVDSQYIVWQDSTLKESKRLEAIYNAGKGLLRTQPDSAFSLFDKGLGMARRHSYYGKEVTKIKFGIGFSYYVKGQYDSAIVYYHLALERWKSEKNWKDVSAVFNQIGIVMYLLGNYAEAKFSHDSAQLYYSLYQPSKLQLEALNNTGLVYLQIGILDSAELYFKQAITLARDNKKKSGSPYINLGNIALMRSDFALGLTYADSALVIYKSTKDYYHMALAHRLFANCYRELGEYSKALYYSNLSYDLGVKLNIPQYQTSALAANGRIYYHLNQYDSTISLCQEALFQANDKDFESLEFIYHSLHMAYQKIGQKDSSLRFLTLQIEAEDSAKSQENRENAIKKLAWEEIKKREKKIKRISAKNTALNSDRRYKNTIIAVMILFISLVAVILIFYRRKQQENRLHTEKNIREMESGLTEMAMSLRHKKEIINDLKNSLENLKDKGKINTPEWIELRRKLQQETDVEKDIVLFEEKLQVANRLFFVKLKSKNATLSKRDLRLAALIRMGLSSKEIAEIFSITPASVDVSRYRLRKKLQMEGSGEKLSTFLKKIH